MADRLTGTQRAAVRLALGVLRRGCAVRARATSHAVFATEAAWEALYMEPFLRAGWTGHEALQATAERLRVTLDGDCPPRLVRARLALYLRALLRADLDDCGGRWECEGCGGREGGDRIVQALLGRDPGPCCAVARDEWTSRITPLWERARAHGVDRG